jgi:LDH2 family malate/lactate/ureidoglycolate dehydrogenase
LYGDEYIGTPQEHNGFIIAVDLARLNQPEAYYTAAARFREEIESCPPAEGVSKVMWPGQPEAEMRERQLDGGIGYSEDELRSISALESRFSTKLVG